MAPLNNPAMKRLKKELEEIEDGCRSLDESRTAIAAFPIEGNFFEWHFTMTGPDDSEFSEGLYHGKIKFPTNYPFAPPDIIFTTPSGRFSVGNKICLTVTGFHPESWQPAWSTRTILLALRHHMAIDDNAVGSIKASAEERKKYAKESHKAVCKDCGYKAAEMLENVGRAKAASSASESEDEEGDTETSEDITIKKKNRKKKIDETMAVDNGSNLTWTMTLFIIAIVIIIVSVFAADI